MTVSNNHLREAMILRSRTTNYVELAKAIAGSIALSRLSATTRVDGIGWEMDERDQNEG